MLILRYPPGDTPSQELADRLSELVLAHKLEEEPALPDPVLHDGRQEITGAAAIHLHLDEIQGEQHHWWYCSC